MGNAEMATVILNSAVVLIAAVMDVWKGKIYNWFTLPLLLAAGIIQLAKAFGG